MLLVFLPRRKIRSFFFFNLTSNSLDSKPDLASCSYFNIYKESSLWRNFIWFVLITWTSKSVFLNLWIVEPLCQIQFGHLLRLNALLCTWLNWIRTPLRSGAGSLQLNKPSRQFLDIPRPRNSIAIMLGMSFFPKDKKKFADWPPILKSNNKTRKGLARGSQTHLLLL